MAIPAALPFPSHMTPTAPAVHFLIAGIVASATVPAFAQAVAETTLPEVTVTAAADHAYNVRASSSATKTETPLLDTPQSLTVITRELIRDQAMQSLADAVRYVPGIGAAQGEGNRDALIFRGNASTSDFYIDGIRDDAQYFRDFYNLDRVEVLRGSNAMIFGRGGAGGVVNRVTKQPEWIPVREASLTLGSWGSRRAAADIGQAMNDRIAVRVNAVAENSNSFRDGVKVERYGINPTMAIRAGANTSVVLGYERFRDDRVADRGVPSFNGKPFVTDRATFFGSSALSPTWVRVDALTASVDHDVGGGFTLRNRTRFADYDKLYQNVFAASAVKDGGRTVDLGAYNDATQRTTFFNQTDLSYTLAAGNVRHRLVGGVELGNQETDNLRTTGYFGANNTVLNVPTANPVPTTPITFRPAPGNANNHSVSKTASVYVQDQVELSRRWQAVLGVRYDRFSVDFRNNRTGETIRVTDTPVSPRAGLIFKPQDNMSLYGSYSIAYVPRAGEQLTSLSVSNKSFDPEQFTNVELGAKWDIRPDLAATAALYKLERTNVILPASVPGDNSTLADGQTSKGIELGLSGRVTPAWNVMAGYAYTRARLSSELGGKVLAQVPDHALSLWNRYDISAQWGAAIGIVYRDSIFTSNSNAVTLPSFTRFDGALYYTLNKQFKVQVNVENLLDRRYYASAHNDNNISPGSPRAVRMTLVAKF